MTHYTASIDAGNGGVNAVLAKGTGKLKSHYEPSVRAAATGDSLGLGAALELDYQYIDWNGHRYITGDDVLKVTKRHLERHIGINRYGDEFHQFLVAVALAKLGVKDGEVDLTLFAPPGMYLSAKQTMQERFCEQNGGVQIMLKGDKKPRQWRYSAVNVLPEGIGAALCFVLDDKGAMIETDALAGDVVVLDMGAKTCDAVLLTDGNFNPESLQSATWENGGLDVHIRQPIVAALKKRADDFAHVTVDDVDATIRRGLESGDWTLRAGGLEADVKPLVDKFRETYAGWIANNICDGVFDGFRGIKSVILVGGGVVLASDFLAKWYGPKLLDHTKHETTKKLHPVDMNAVGGIRFARMQGRG